MWLSACSACAKHAAGGVNHAEPAGARGRPGGAGGARGGGAHRLPLEPAAGLVAAVDDEVGHVHGRHPVAVAVADLLVVAVALPARGAPLEALLLRLVDLLVDLLVAPPEPPAHGLDQPRVLVRRRELAEDGGRPDHPATPRGAGQRRQPDLLQRHHLVGRPRRARLGRAVGELPQRQRRRHRRRRRDSDRRLRCSTAASVLFWGGWRRAFMQMGSGSGCRSSRSPVTQPNRFAKTITRSGGFG